MWVPVILREREGGHFERAEGRALISSCNLASPGKCPLPAALGPSALVTKDFLSVVRENLSKEEAGI